MSSRFLPLLKKCPTAVYKAISILNKGPLNGETRVVDFQIGPPAGGLLTATVCIDHHRAFQCMLSDTFPSILPDLRDWMERCLRQDHEGTLHPEFITVDCPDTVLHVIMIHVGWEEERPVCGPVSFLVITRSDLDEPSLCCFCNTLETIRSLYDAILDCLERFRPFFDNPASWYDIKRFDCLNPLSTTDRMKGQIHSSLIEKKTCFFQKSRQCDDICQTPLLPLHPK